MAKWLSPWRGWMLAAGGLMTAGGIPHPRGGTMEEMLADPIWVPSHTVFTLGAAALLIGILTHSRAILLPPATRRWAWLAIAATALELVELVFHTASVVDLESLRAGLATPVLSTHLTLALVGYPLWGIAVAGWVVSTARSRTLGTPWLAAVGAVGILSYGFAPLANTLFTHPVLGLLFPLILLFTVWVIAAGLWPARIEGILTDAARSGSNRLLFQTMYRIGYTPWDGHPLPEPLEAIAAEPTKGRALDLGCGTGDTSVFLARAGWEVVGVDFVEAALAKARKRAETAGVSPRFVQGDVTRLAELGIGDGFRLIVDNGCLHGLSDEDREAAARGIQAVAVPDARMVVSAFPRGPRRGPRGLDRSDLERWFGAGWTISAGEADPRLANQTGDSILVYELRRRVGVGAGV